MLEQLQAQLQGDRSETAQNQEGDNDDDADDGSDDPMDQAKKRRSGASEGDAKRRRHQDMELAAVENDIAHIRLTAEQLRGAIEAEEQKRQLIEEQLLISTRLVEEKDSILAQEREERTREQSASAEQVLEAQEEMLKAKDEAYQAQQLAKDLQSTCEEALNELEVSKASVREQQQTIAALEQRAAAAAEQQQTMATAMAALEERVQMSELLLLQKSATGGDKLTALHAEVDMLRAEREAITADLQQAQAQCTANSSAQDECARLLGELQAANHQLALLQSERDEMCQAMSQLQAELTVANGAARAASEDQDQLRGELLMATAARDALEAQLASFQQAHATSTQLNTETAATQAAALEAIKAEYESSVATIQALQQQTETALQEQQSTMAQQMLAAQQSYEQTVARLTMELDQQTQAVQALQLQCQDIVQAQESRQSLFTESTEAHQQEAATLAAQLDEAAATIARLQAQVAADDSDNEIALRSDHDRLETAQQQLDAAQQQLEDVLAQLQFAKANNEELLQRCNVLEQEAASNVAQRTALSEQLTLSTESTNDDIAKLTEEVRQKETSYAALQEQFTILQAQFAPTDAISHTTTEALALMEQQVADKNEEIATLEVKLASLESTARSERDALVRDTEAAMADAQARLQQADQRLADMAAEMERTQDETIEQLSSFRAEIVQLTADLEAARDLAVTAQQQQTASSADNETICRLENEIAFLKDEHQKDLEARSIIVNEMREQHLAELQSAADDMERIRASHEQLMEEKLAHETKTHEVLQSAADEARSELAALREEHSAFADSIEASKQETQQKLMALVEERDAAVHRLKDSEQRLKQLSTELELASLQAQQQSAATENDTARFQELEQSLLSMRSELAARDSLVSDLTSRVRSLQEELAMQQSLGEEMQASSDATITTLREVQDRLSELSDQLSEKSDTVRRLETELQTLRQENELQASILRDFEENSQSSKSNDAKSAAIIDELKENVRAKEAAARQLERSLQEVTVEKDLQSAMMAELEDKYEDKSRQLAELAATRLSAMAGQIEKLQAEKTAAHAQMANLRAEADALQEQADSQFATLSDMQTQNAKMVGEMRQRSSELDRLQALLRTSEATAAQLRDDLQRARAAEEDAARLPPLREEVAKLQKKLRSSQSDIRALEEARSSEVLELRRSIDEMQDTMRHQAAAAVAIEERSSKGSEQTAALQETVRVQETKLEAFLQEMRELREQAAKDSISLAHAQAALQQAKQQVCIDIDVGPRASYIHFSFAVTLQ